MWSITLSHGKVAVVDDHDYEDLRQDNWHASKCGDVWYARRGEHCLFMHRLVMERAIGRPLQPGELVDHVNRDTLDNRRSNLRVATKAQNSQNEVRRIGASRFKGVARGTHSKVNPWRAYINACGRQIALGRFPDEESAARAYDEAAAEYFGEFARTNFPQETR